MKMIAYTAIATTALAGSPPAAQAAGADSGVEFGSMPFTMTVTLLNKGGKYVALDLKRIPQGGTCRMDEGAIMLELGLVPQE